MIIGSTRGSFPKVPHKEAPQDKRRRYEEWLIATRKAALATDAARAEGPQTSHLDPEYDAVMAQPNHGKATRPSKTLSVRARCWQCVSGDDDDGGTTRIKECVSQGCALWSVRPYQEEDSKVPRRSRAVIKISEAGVHRLDHGAKALAAPGNRSLAVRGYCHQCAGGTPDISTMRDVADCRVAHCALWVVRPGAGEDDPDDGASSALKVPLSGVKPDLAGVE